ncbi:MAG: intradiol ring-cleavage dioxygenase [Acidimicrobiales bacterium]
MLPAGTPLDDAREAQVETEEHEHDRGLAYDLSVLFDRRRALKLLAGLGAFTLVGCRSDSETAGGQSGTTASTAPASTAPGTTGATVPPTVAAATGTCKEIPNETAGPFPGDGSNGPNVLNQSGIVRSDITSSFGSMSGTASGVPLTINLTIVDDSKSCAPMANAAVYIWHCDQTGGYSLYSQGVTNQNYLRGVQQADNRGVVTFKTVFPAAYSGRWPHVHFEVYPNLNAATSVGNKIATSQLALPEDVCNTVFATSGYERSVANMRQTPLSRDMVFSDGVDQQMATTTGSVNAGYVASLFVPVS